MNKTVPWNIKGVGFDAREVAHMAARRAGMPLGDWLNSVIYDRAEELGVSTRDFSEDERLDALVARLAGVAESVHAEESPESERKTSRQRTEAVRSAGAHDMSDMMAEDETPELRGILPRRARKTGNGADVGEEIWTAEATDRGQARRRGGSDWDSDILLDQAMALVTKRRAADEERVSGEGQRRTVAALAKEMERMNRVDPRDEPHSQPVRARNAVRQEAAPRPLRDAVGSVAERIGEIESRIAHRDADLANRPIVAALSRLEDRFEHLMRRNADGAKESAKVEATFRDLDARLRDIAGRLDHKDSPTRARPLRMDEIEASMASRLDATGPLSERSTPNRDDTEDGPARPGRKTGRDAIADIMQRQADLDRAEQRRAALLNSTSQASFGLARGDEPPRQREAGTTPAGGAGAVSAAASADPFGNLNEAFIRLTDRLEARLDEAARAQAARARPESDDIGSLKNGIAALGERLDAMREEAEQSRATHHERDDLDSLRNEIAALQVGLAKLAPQTAISTLENAVRELGTQIDESRRDGVSEAVVGPLERLRQEVHRALEERDVQGTLAKIEEQLGFVSSRVDHLAAGEPALEQIGDFRSETGEIRDLIRTAVGNFQAVERLEVEIGQLTGKLERLSEAPPRSAIRDLELAINEIRTMLVTFSPDTALRDVAHKLDRFAERFEVLEEQVSAPAAMIDEFTRRMDHAHAALADRLLKAAPAVDLAPIETMIGGLSGKIDGLKHSSADLQALGGLVRGLAAQIEEARLPSADAKIIDTLETQVGRLAERLDHSDASLDAISSVERLVRDLFQQVDETRSATIDAAEQAARTAAQEALRGALVSPQLAGEEGSNHATRVVEQVGHELAEFRKAQQVSEKRVHSTLLALNETLERMVDRMVSDGTRPAAPAIPAAKAAAIQVSKPAAPSAPEQNELRPVENAAPVEIKAPVAAALPAAKPAAEPAGAVEVKRPVPAGKTAAPTVEIGRPSVGEPMPDVSPLIAAARRAAQAASASANEVSRKVEAKDTVVAEPGSSGVKSWRSFLGQKRRPLLLSLASVVLLLGALQVVRLTQGNHETTAANGGDRVAESGSDGNSVSPSATASIAPAAPVSAAKPGQASSTAQASLLSGDASLGSDKSLPATTTFVAADPAPKTLAQGLRDLADHGNATAQAEVGARLFDGRGGVSRDSKAATSWFERSAKQGYAPAEYRLGSAYEKGTGVAVDPAQAVSWYEKAAMQGNIRAMHNLAVMAAEGAVAKPDYARAASWFTKAAEHGVRDSQYNLAILYARGLGVSQDLSQSYTWFAIAAAQGDADAAKKRDDVAGKLSADQLAAASAAATSFKPQSVDRAANDITPPPGGWDVAAAPVSGSPKLSSM